jgi:uncharacterized protein (DUF2141 family)
MMTRVLISAAAVALIGAAPVVPNPSLGKAEAACRAGETGPALHINVVGLKDRNGLVRAELYPANDPDFLSDDAILVNAGKTFRRVDLPIPSTGPVTLCMRIPGPGRYSLSLLHDRDRNLKFTKFSDGVGFGSNPKLGWSQPKAAAATITAGPGISDVNVVMNYLRGLSFGPLKRP